MFAASCLQFQRGEFEIRAFHYAAAGRSAPGAMQALSGNGVAFGRARRAVDADRDFFDDQTRTLQQSSFTGQFIREQQRFADDTGKRAQLEVDRAHTSATLPLDLFFGAFDNA